MCPGSSPAFTATMSVAPSGLLSWVDEGLPAIGLNCLDGPLLWLDRVPDSVALLVTGDMPGTNV